MNLSSDLISQFVKETRDTSKVKTETVVYGTVKIVDGETYAQLDGSELLTPVNATATTKEGDRVTVMIKNHTATVTGNISSPSATHESVKEVGDRVDQFDIVLADKITTDELSAINGTINNLKTKLANISKLEAVDAEIESLVAKFTNIEYITANDIEAVTATIESLHVKFGEFTDVSIEDLNALKADIQTLRGYTADFTYVSAEVLKAMKADINDLNVKKLDAESAKVTYANIDFSNIKEAAIRNIFGETGLIKDLTVGDQTLTGELVGVTISGDLIKANTLKADKLVVLGSDGLYYKLNIEAGAVESAEVSKEDLQNGLHGTAIIAKTITAEKISVSDLVAFGATIGGYHITNTSLYSGVKSSADNTTRGVYLDTDGQMAVGDSNNFIRYYKDSSGNYVLDVSADTIRFGTDRKTVSEIDQKTDDIADSVNRTFAGTSDPEIHNGSAIYLSNISEVEKTAKVTVEGVNLLDVSAYDALGGVTYDSTTGSFTSNINNSYYCRFRTSALNELFMNNLEKTFVFSANTGITGRFMSIIIGGTRSNGSTYQEVNGTSGSRYVSIAVASDFTSINYVEFRWNRANSAFTDTTTVVSELQLEFGNIPTTYADYVDPTSKVSLKRVGSNVANITTPVSGWFLDSNGTGTTADSRFVRLYALAVKPNTTYTLSSNLEIYSVWNATDSGPISQIVTQVNTNEVTVTTCENVARLRITLNNTSGAADTTAFEWFMVSYGSEALPYEPYTEELFEITPDGTPYDIPLLSPNTTLLTDIQGVNITCNREKNPLRSLETSIQILKDSFKTLVRGQNGQSVMTQTEDGWYFDVTKIEDTIKSAADEIKKVSENSEEIGGALDEFRGEVGELTSRVYVGTTTPDGETKPCIYIQEKDSAFKICITNEYIGFYEDASKLLWITNKKINADSIVVNEELSIANEHTWKRRQVKSRMHTSLIFVGAKNLIPNAEVAKSSSVYNVAKYTPKEFMVVDEKYTVTICWTPAAGVTAMNLHVSQGNGAYLAQFETDGTNRQQTTSKTFTCKYIGSYTPEANAANGQLWFYRWPNDDAVTGTTTIHWIRVTKGGS